MTHANPPDWEAQLKDALDAVSDLADEAPPRLESLQMLVVQVRGEQRRETWRALAAFWAVAVVIIGSLLLAMSRQPVFFLIAEGAVALVMLAGAALYARKRVTE